MFPCKEKMKTPVLCAAICAMFVASLAYAAAANAAPIEAGQKAKVKGTVVSRHGDLVTIKNAKDGSTVVVALTDSTKYERHKAGFRRNPSMDVTLMLPGLGIEAEGVGNPKGQIQANTIIFNPSEFEVEALQEKQIMANQAAAKAAQTTATKGVADAKSAQADAVAAGALGVMDAAAIATVNKRVSDLDDYKAVAVAAIFFASKDSALDDAAKADLSKLAAVAMSTEGYMIEIAGYASSTGSKEQNQKLTDARAEVVANYLRNAKNVPMRRILAPAGYGASHAVASNVDPMGRALNRRVDVTVLVNKAMNETM